LVVKTHDIFPMLSDGFAFSQEEHGSIAQVSLKFYLCQSSDRTPS